MSNTLRGADIVVRSLHRVGCRRVFTLSGNHIMSIFDAALDAGLDLVHVRHEAAAVHMADAHGRLTGEAGVALVTGGPGHANAVGALYTALAAESPMVLLSGHAATWELGRGGFQELRQADMAEPVTKASWTVSDAGALGRDIGEAVRIACSGRRGPVHLSLPSDLLDARLDESAVTWPIASPAAREALGEADCAKILSLLAAAQRPIIFAGPQMSNGRGRDLLARLEAATGVLAVILESPRGLADATLGTLSDVAKRVDLVVLLGKALDFSLKWTTAPSFDPDVRIICIDPDAELAARAKREKGDALVFACVADPALAAEKLATGAEQIAPPDPAWLAEAQRALDARPASWQAVTAKTPGRLHPAEVFRALRPFIARDPDTILICDGGEYAQWAQSMLPVRRRLVNGVAGSIGSALSFALAARLIESKAPVFAVLGDGTIGFHIAEFETAVRCGLPFVAILGNDARWNAESEIQRRDYGANRMHGCELTPVRYDQVVTALGGHGEYVERAADLPAAIERALASGKPACVNVMIESTAAPALHMRSFDDTSDGPHRRRTNLLFEEGAGMPVTYPGVDMQELPSAVHTITGVATSIAAFIGWAPMGPVNEAVLVQSWTDFQDQFGGLNPQSKLGYAVNQFFGNGGQQAYIVRVTWDPSFKNPVGTPTATAIASATVSGMTLYATSPGLWANGNATNPPAWVIGLNVVVTVSSDNTRFGLTVQDINNNPLESFANLSTNPLDPGRYAATVVDTESQYVTFIDPAHPTQAPSIPGTVSNGAASLSGGADGTPLNPATDGNFELAMAEAGFGLSLLDSVPIFNLLCVPGETDNATIQTLQKYCAGRRALYIVDCPQDITYATFSSVSGGPGPIATTGTGGGTNTLVTHNNFSSYSAYYYPWVLAPDPLAGNRATLFPPCGFVAGLYAATDAARGVWKAPAGIAAEMSGALGLQVNLTDAQNGTLNPVAVNCLREFSAYGDVVWGSRTLDGNDELGSQWKYVPIRRLAMYIETSLYDGTQWVVFEPNGEPLWSQIRLNVGSFMQGLFLQGALQGSSPQQAYFVKCDGENNPQSSIDQGIVNILVGFAPLYPAEFVVIAIQQMAGQAQS